MIAPSEIDADTPLLIAGPTASGKSGLALGIAEERGGVVVNADALQVFSDWRVLTARPSPAEEARVPHRLYGHVPGDAAYSVGDWLREIAALLAEGPRPIIVGGTGLYFRALTEGLAEIPPVPDAVREEATARLAAHGVAALARELDRESAARIDLQNPMRVQRAWEVLTATGRGIASWQDATPPPLLPLSRARAFVIDASKDWLTPRIAARMDAMLDGGALDEAEANAPSFHPARPSAKAIGASALVAHVRGEMTLEDARAAAITQTVQFAKRQRTFFRNTLGDWPRLHPAREAA